MGTDRKEVYTFMGTGWYITTDFFLMIDKLIDLFSDDFLSIVEKQGQCPGLNFAHMIY